MDDRTKPGPDPKQRFSDRVEDYVKYRPSYPPDVLEMLQEEIGFDPTWTVADVGSGTGILTELLLRHGNTVFAIEPNQAMRAAAEHLLPEYPRFHSVAGAAEDTTLEPGSVDLVTAAQAFHWFDPPRSRAEFRRILRPHGWIVLVWNDRLTDSTPFLRAYDELLRTLGTDYEAVNHRKVDDARLREWFAGEYRSAELPNVQHFDWEGLRGRALSSSYVPAPGHPKHNPFLEALRTLYDAYQKNGRVYFDYTTRIYWARR